MLQFPGKTPDLGIEITSLEARMAAVAKGRKKRVVSVASSDIPAGLVSEDFVSPSVSDRDRLSEILKGCLKKMGGKGFRQAALSLPDGLFRVQILEFDEIPPKKTEQERLIRWRIEKATTFDTSDTIMRYQAFRRQGAGFVVIACFAKRAIISEYESILTGIGLEAWNVGLSSFHTLDFYAPYIINRSSAAAVAFVTATAFTTIIIERGLPTFHRYKELKRISHNDTSARLIREIVDSLHFYAHRDRLQSESPNIERLYMAGEPGVLEELFKDIAPAVNIEVEVLSPSVTSTFSLNPSLAPSPVFSAAIGAGGML